MQNSAATMSTTGRKNVTSTCPASTFRMQKQNQSRNVSAKMSLSSLCNSNDWDATLEWIRNKPSDAAAQILDNNKKSTTILHKILTSRIIDPKSRLAIVKEILRVAPNAASARNHHSSLPLHVAARNNLKMDGQTKERLLSALIKAYPAALTTQDAVKHTPLHVACEKWCSCRDLKILIGAAPEAATMKDEKGLLPIHIACTRRCSPDKLRLLLDAYPDCVEDVSNDGSTPLSVATASATQKHPNSALIRMLNEAIQDRKKYGRHEKRKRSGSYQSPSTTLESDRVSSAATSNSSSHSGSTGIEADLTGEDKHALEESVAERQRLSESAASSGAEQNKTKHPSVDRKASNHYAEKMVHLPHASQQSLALVAAGTEKSSEDAAAGPLTLQAHQQQVLERGRLAGVLPPRDMLGSLGEQALWIVAQMDTTLPFTTRLQLKNQHEIIIKEMCHRHKVQNKNLEQLRRDTDRLMRLYRELKD